MNNLPLLSTLATMLLCIGVIRLSQITHRFDDNPGGTLKPHGKPVPRIGGVAFGLPLLVLLFSPLLEFPTSWSLSLAIFWVLGLFDDLFSLSPIRRLVVEIIAGGLLLIESFHLVWNFSSFLAAALLLVIWVNATNWNDGRNGLATLSILGITIPTALLTPHSPTSTLALFLSAVLLGFLPFNLQGRIFMGDAGSYLLGTAALLLGGGAWLFHHNPGPALGMVPLLIDGAQVLLTRWREKRPLMAGDRSHIYDRLIARGWSLPAVLLLYSGSTLLITLIGSLLFTT